MATGDDDNDGATGNEVDDEGDGATGYDNDDDDNNGDNALPLRCHCQRPALPSCAAAALRRQHCTPPLRCSCQRLALPVLRCSTLHCRRCAARRQQIDNNNKDNNHLHSRPTQMLRPPPLFLEQSK
jgi:hypothetical protein